MNNLFKLVVLLSGVGLWAESFANAQTPAKQLVVYSARAEQLVKPIFEAYTKKTGVQIKFVTDKEGPLMQKLKAEGEDTPADVFITVDAGNLWLAAKEDLLATVDSKQLNANIPAHLRDPGNRWFGMSVRARTLFFNPEKVKANELSTYEDLALPKWKNRLCLRTSKKVYNQSLVAMMISLHGLKKTEEIVKGWVANLAAEPFADDTKMLEAIAAGQCQIGIANTYYFGRLLKDKPALKVSLFWPNQAGHGVHVNVSGVGVAKFSKNKTSAIDFIEWLSGTEAQSLFADSNMEYPANANVSPSKEVVAWGEFKQNLINVSQAGELQVEAMKLMDRVAYK